MKINNIISGTFQERPNRFTVLFETERKTEKHIYEIQDDLKNF